ncbi:glycoside hydrolase family 2 protein [Cryomorphaceae bacterium 1068]|nr:glycoside hydrolase family 2 protein [Cryomorphaceae bacterium 1068]
MRLLILVFLLVSISACKLSTKELIRSERTLHENWEFSQEGDSAFRLANVPGQVHLDLLANDIIEDPFWQDNELKQRWIEEENWIYKTEFSVSSKTLKNENIELVFEGLDTDAEVFLNGETILKADNMFRTWRVNAKSYLKKGMNELRIVFESPVNHNRELVSDYRHQLPSGNESDDIPVKVAAFSRKAAYHFGWDWGPRFVTSGIWKDIKLVTWNKVRIKNAFTRALSANREVAHMRTVIELEASVAGIYEILLKQKTKIVNLKVGTNTIVHDFDIHRPKLWWTNGHGQPNLYSQKIKLRIDKTVLDSTTDTYGVRKIELIDKPDSIGTSFYFKLNGKPIFMKGANYIPQDVFLSRVTPEKYQALIAAAKEANMNMLRVWGGGIYEQDLFYDLCDQNGILVWQDFMFAGSLYPDDDGFKENVAKEVVDNIVRLRSHPCIALWCGNNEIEVAWENWGWQEQYGYSEQDSIEIWNNYVSIFQKLIPELVAEYHPSASYTSTSPLSNWGTAENFNHSSMHYWGVWHGREPFEEFENNVGRFMVEYGFQSYPEMSTLKTVMADSSLRLDSPLMSHRQKSYIGNGLITEHIEQYYDPPQSFEEFVDLSQKTQALGLEMAIEAHMNKRPHCMGTLFWQLNDCWPGPSWSVIDYYGNRKTSYSAVKSAFSETK